MQKIFVILAILPTFIYASYNPFFSDKTLPPKPTVQKQEVKIIIQKPKPKPKPIPTRQNINMTYSGFIESTKGKFALVNFDEKNIVIKKNDSLYLNEKIFKITKITSNYILVSDKHCRVQTVYFTSDEKQN
ncbi:MAG: hypothetical protein L3J10_01620 [Sulfurimonas sp.]|nr:hypothetical protein [Sulfurimonas sp.]